MIQAGPHHHEDPLVLQFDQARFLEGQLTGFPAGHILGRQRAGAALLPVGSLIVRIEGTAGLFDPTQFLARIQGDCSGD